LWDEKKTGAVLYKGIAERPFERSFQLADYVVVKGARLENGLLNVDLERVVRLGKPVSSTLA